jgi:hypothetical protein
MIDMPCQGAAGSPNGGQNSSAQHIGAESLDLDQELACVTMWSGF